MDASLNSSPRRKLLNLLLGTGTVADLGSIVYPILRFINPPRTVESSASSVVAGEVTEMKLNEGKIFKFGSRPRILIETPGGEYRAVSALRTHLDFTVQYR